MIVRVVICERAESCMPARRASSVWAILLSPAGLIASIYVVFISLAL